MSRAKSKPLLLLERIETVLAEDIATHPELWFETPRTVTIRPTAATAEAERPLVAIELTASAEQEEGTLADGGPIFRDLASVTAWLETDDAADPQASILELASDFRRFLMRHPQLEAEDGEAFIECGQIQNTAFSVAVDYQEGGPGGGLAEFTFQIDYTWTSTTG